jgi:hypothetical protein
MNNETKLNWKQANKRQRKQYMVGPAALVAKVDSLFIDDGRTEFQVHCEIVCAGDYVQYYFWNDDPNPFEALDLFVSKPVAGYVQEQREAEIIFDPKRIYMSWFQREGWKVEA